MGNTQEKVTPEALTESQRYIASFAEAMRAIEAKYKKEKIASRAFLELARRGMWNPDYISRAYVLVVGKLSPLSRRLREYILAVGELAHQIYDKAAELEKEKAAAEPKRKRKTKKNDE